MEDSLHTLRRLPQRTVFSWTSIISGLVNQKCNYTGALQVYVCMKADGIEPDEYTLVALLKACGNLKEIDLGRRFHGDARRTGLSSSDSFVATTLISMYGKCGSIKEAEHVFLEVSSSIWDADVVLWNAMLSAYLEQNKGEKALILYAYMQGWVGIKPNQESLQIALQACSSLIVDNRKIQRDFLLEIVRGLHIDAQNDGVVSHAMVRTALLCAYSKCGELQEAEKVFYAVVLLDVVPWTAMLSAYVDNEEEEKALLLYAEMQKRGIMPNDHTIVCALQACSNALEECYSQSQKVILLEIGKAIHADMRKRGLACNIFISNALMSMYKKAMAIADAENVFCSIFHQDVVSWTTMISLYVEYGNGKKALLLYRHMHIKGVSPNHYTIVATLQACGILANNEKFNYVNEFTHVSGFMLLDVVYALHADAQKKGIDSDRFVCTTLINIYGRFGNLLGAKCVFESFVECSTVTWNAMLSNYTENGQGEKTLDLYRHMRTQGVHIDVCTLVCALQACTEICNLDMCKKLHFDSLCAGLDLDYCLSSSLIGAYGNNLDVIDATVVAYGFPQLDVVSWNACISGYAKEGKSEGSLKMFEQMKLENHIPTEASFTSLLSACSHTGLIDQGLKYFESMVGMYHIVPEMKHYVNIIDLLGRAGDFIKIENVLNNMPMRPDLAIYLCLLGVCLIQGNLELGKLIFLHLVHLHPHQDSVYVLMSNILIDALHEDEKLAMKDVWMKEFYEDKEGS